ncbi:MAG: hybrid sensor histidine kinase/response regulator [Burkholderiaceae bacterium]|nr:MAG: hybrid sensor histidine kinase/response regulator [Burkholderiaceae bacterium]
MNAPDSLPPISPEGQARLLEMTYQRLHTSIMVLPLVALGLALFYQLQSGDARLGWWVGFYAAFAAFAFWLRQRWRSDASRLNAAAVMQRWRPRLERLALVHGLGTTAPWAIAATGTPHYEFAMVLLVTHAITVAGNATHQTPVFSVFQRFFIAGWCASLPFQPWVFPELWPYSLGLSLLHTFTMVRHARRTHRFFVQQVGLEEQGRQLSAQYRNAKEQAEAALAEKNRFLSTASHDLRQPVHAMGLLTEAIALRNQDDALTAPLSDLRLNLHSLQLMFNSLLDLSKIESGQVAVRPEALPLRPLLSQIEIQFQAEAHARGLRLRTRLPAPGTTVQADAALLHQSLANLIHNALRFTLRGGVLVGVRRRNGHWRIEVWDTGLGVALQDHTRIYQPFYRPQNAWHIDREGHGLGLAVVARCAQLMGIHHGLRSQLDRGSCFWLDLPAAPPVPDSVPLPATTAPAHRLQGRCLVLDDDPQVQRAWAALLTSWGVETRMAMDATQAFAHLSEGFAPQAILCDQRLRSGESGFDILQALLERCPEARGAMVSGEFDAPELQQAEAEGYLVLRKPVDAPVLHALLAQWLGPQDFKPNQPQTLTHQAQAATK